MLEINKNIQVQIIEKNNGNKSAAATYVFDNNDFSNSKGIKDVDEMVSIKMRHKIWQIIPAICSKYLNPVLAYFPRVGISIDTSKYRLPS